jgi:prepilin-type N-terminal cleavage/methylation domain-containing protein
MALTHAKRTGFTLVELMIALVAGSFAVAGVYYLNGVTARAFSQQMAVSDSQMSLRSAMEQVRRDFARAGYLGTPSTKIMRDCDGAVNSSGTGGISPRWLQALRIKQNGSLTYNAPSGTQVAALLDTPSTNKVRADEITLWGNYATADAYLTDPSLNTQSVISFQTTSEAFRRSFFTPAPANGAATEDAAQFTGTFAVGRMLRVEHGGRYWFRDITASAWPAGGTPTVTLGTALPDCVEVTGWLAVAPIVRVHYGLESDLGADFTRVRANTALPGSRRPLLVRREENTATGALIAGTARVVLDYAVEFGVDAVVNTVGNMTARPTWGYALGAAAETASDTPEYFRSLVVTLATRSAEADPRMPAIPRARWAIANTLNSPLMTFRVLDPNFATVAMNARVRTMRSEIFLQNL